MKSLKVLTGIAIASVGLTAVVTVGVVNQRQNNSLLETKAATFAYDVSQVTTRRVYYVNNNSGGHWYKGTALYVYAWYGEENSGLVESHLLYEDYSDWGGIWYADISFAGCGGKINIMFSNNSSWGAKTGELYDVPALSSKSADVIYINNGSPSYGSAGMSATQLVSVLDQIHTCNTTYHDGYYAYPQLNANFFVPSAGAIAADAATTDVADVDAESHHYTLKNKIDELEYMYTNYGWTVA